MNEGDSTILTKIIPKTSDSIMLAATELRAGHCVVLPTETVYGLAAIGDDDMAVSAIYAIKNRPKFNPLILHGSSLDMLKEYAVFTPLACALADHYWPGPLTMVLPATEKVSALARAGLSTVAVRVPRNDVFRAVIDLIGKPLVAPSANPSNYLSATTAEDVKHGFDQFAQCAASQNELLILDGGICEYGVESTIVDLSGEMPSILRHGGLSFEELQVIMPNLIVTDGKKIKAPGQLKTHYAPTFPLRINAETSQSDEVWIGFGKEGEGHRRTPLDMNLSISGDLKEAAANLFPALHRLDALFCQVNKPFTGVAVAKIPQKGLGVAINDRLERASINV